MEKTVAHSGNDIFEKLLGDIKYPKNSKSGELYPFTVRCGLVKRRPPRHDFFQYILNMGRADIDRVLEHKPLRPQTQEESIDLTFVLPERWLGVKEQVDFMFALTTHPDVERIKTVDILTSSPMILGSFMAAQVRILTWSDDEDDNSWTGFV